MGPVRSRTILRVMVWKMVPKYSTKTMTMMTWLLDGNITSSSIPSMLQMQSSMSIKMVTQTSVKKNGIQIHVNQQASLAKVNTVTTLNDVFRCESAP